MRKRRPRLVKPKAAHDLIMARTLAGLSQAQAAELCGVSLRSWQYYESGEVKLSKVRVAAHLRALAPRRD